MPRPLLLLLCPALLRPAAGVLQRGLLNGSTAAEQPGLLAMRAHRTEGNNLMTEKSVESNALKQRCGQMSVLQCFDKSVIPEVERMMFGLCGMTDPNKALQRCANRFKVLDRFHHFIKNGDQEIIHLLRRSVKVLRDFQHVAPDVHQAIASLTKTELDKSVPFGMGPVADLNNDGSISRKEWETYLKTLFLFTTLDDVAPTIGLLEKTKTKLAIWVRFDLQEER
mmetsp:Transcript_107043/g.302641  ORF Transcript_107043/g.302641 Transcript_107043/m.302641 type:complete len:224 (-) Transcript_107043:148-819(-)